MKAPTKIKNSISKFSPGKIKVLVFDVDDTITRGTLGIKVDCFKHFSQISWTCCKKLVKNMNLLEREIDTTSLPMFYGNLRKLSLQRTDCDTCRQI